MKKNVEIKNFYRTYNICSEWHDLDLFKMISVQKLLPQGIFEMNIKCEAFFKKITLKEHARKILVKEDIFDQLLSKYNKRRYLHIHVYNGIYAFQKIRDVCGHKNFYTVDS
jgi:hypothetical protein